MQPVGINPGLLRAVLSSQPELLSELLTPGRTFDADVVSVHQGRAILALDRGLRVEVALQADLKEGQHVKVQVQPRETQQTGDPGRPAPIVLRVVQPETAAGPPVQFQLRQVLQGAPHPAETAGADRAARAQGQIPLEAARPGAAEQPPQVQTQVQTQGHPAAPQVVWLPIPVPGGPQAWAQLVVQEEAPGRRQPGGDRQAQVRIWWETPELGPIQVSLDSAGEALNALFTVQRAGAKQSVEHALPDLQQRLGAAGFSGARLAARSPGPGEQVEPLRVPDLSRLDHKA